MSNIQPSNIADLRRDVCSRPYRSAFPKELPDRWLRQIARDLRQIEQMMADSASPDPHMEGPLLIALHILEGRLRERRVAGRMSLSADAFVTWLQVYQFLVERELVTRLIDQPCASNEEALLTAIDFVIDQLVARGGDETVQAF